MVVRQRNLEEGWASWLAAGSLAMDLEGSEVLGLGAVVALGALGAAGAAEATEVARASLAVLRGGGGGGSNRCVQYSFPQI